MRARLASYALAPALLLAACSGHDDVRARYELERMLWRAQYQQRKINIAFLGPSSRDTRAAVDAYRRVLAADPFVRGPRTGWDPDVAADIRALLVTARVALANLYFATERYTDAGTLYAETLELGSMNFKDMLDVRVGAARASYMEGNQRRVIDQCARIFHDVRESPEFWSGDAAIDDVFLNIPVALVRLQRDGGDVAASDSVATGALEFYRRVSDTWPGTRVDWQARVAIAQLHMLRGDWETAAACLAAIVSNPDQLAGAPESLELVLAEIHAFRLGNLEQARDMFQAIEHRHEGSLAAWAARYDLAALRLAQSDAAGAAEGFRELERASGVPSAVASRAMLSRARILERRGAWESAHALLRRLEQLYPFTTAAIEAPLVITRHYVAEQNAAMVQASVAHAIDYYNRLLDRSSAFPGNRITVQAALAESFVASGRADEAARLLSSGSDRWDDTSTAAGMLKAADIYQLVLADHGEARVTLEKVIERFPDTRYARSARERLDQLAAADGQGAQ